jgi:nickel transport protein
VSPSFFFLSFSQAGIPYDNLLPRRLRWPAALAALCLSGAALAHNVWLEPDSDGSYLLQFGGHAGQLEAFDHAKLQSVTAYDRRGRSVPAQVHTVAQGLKVHPDAQAALLAVELDNGFFSGQPGDTAMRNLPMDQNPGPHAGCGRASTTRRCWSGARWRARNWARSSK